ncbi:hypothetical protein [Mahella australiensis]|uniref:ABC-2 type transporter n=1 Tax=Mahella australiensis (strain DSM 15567 / CIP 107919 / 50-1 BON) TaxID=697281 RepID=F3ZWM0_MAHA5|nr:hypothetical protein [Mahella australiensis]AEE96463.1 hypothetical protein Mahau_1269 [Mahella australiensis 50-1 BON]
MNFARLYKKEFMKERKSFAVTLIITLGVMLFLYSRIGQWPTGVPTFVSMTIIFGFGIAAFINCFDYMGDEWKRNNHYLMLSLPVKGRDILSAKLAWFMTEFGAHMLLLGAYTTVMLLAELKSTDVLSAELYNGIVLSVWRLYGLGMLPMLYVLASVGVLGLFSYTAGSTVKRFNFWVGAVSYILPMWLLSYISGKSMEISPAWLHIELPLSNVLAWQQIERALNSNGTNDFNLSFFMNGTFIGIDILAVLIWAAGMIGLFFLASWLLENVVEV